MSNLQLNTLIHEQCPICEGGPLREIVVNNRFVYNGNCFRVDMNYSLCDTCGSKQANAIQLVNNLNHIYN